LTYTYTIYDLTLNVPFPCPMLTSAPIGVSPDVVVIEGQVPHSLKVPIIKDRSWQAVPGLFLFRGGNRAGRFLVEGGQRITLERNPSAEDELLCALLITTVMAALLRQRGLLVLHANVAVTSRGAIAISGESGSGKSTTQAALMAHGCKMLTDDVTVLRLEPDGRVVALPGVPKMNLCEDAAINLGHDVACLPRNPLMGSKVIVSVAPSNSVTEPTPLNSIYIINRHPGKSLIVTLLAGVEKFTALQDCIYGPQFVEELPGLFSLLSAITDQVSIFDLQRPAHGYSVNKVVEAILHG
jgi:hypothetical protein